MTTTIDDDRAGAENASLRERKKLQTRRAIHEAALRLIDADGLEATTIEAICREADVAPRTFFNYFPSKAAAALDLPETVIDEQAAERFRTADGRLVDALCHTFADSADLHAERVRMKELIARRPSSCRRSRSGWTPSAARSWRSPRSASTRTRRDWRSRS